MLKCCGYMKISRVMNTQVLFDFYIPLVEKDYSYCIFSITEKFKACTLR